jgi:hypothetical protein
MGSPNDPLSEAVGKILDSEPAKNLLSPATKELGELFGTFANLARFYVTDNLESVFTKWAKFRNGRIVDAEAVKKVMPLLPLASMVSEDELQERWAALMESTATKQGCLPSFGQALSQVSVEEVQYLDRLWKITRSPGRAKFGHMQLLHAFPGIEAGTFYGGGQDDRLDRAKLAVDDLLRLGILHEIQIAEAGRYAEFGGVKVPIADSGPKLRSEYSFSPYGTSFMQAVTPEHDSSAEETDSLR